MGIKCCVKGCGERSRPGTEVIFHKFSSNLEMRKKWIIALNQEILHLTPNSCVCSKHFRDNDYLKILDSGSKMLLENAVPSLFPYLVDEEHNYALSRSPPVPEKKAMKETQLVISALQQESLPTQKTKVTTENVATQTVTPTLPLQYMTFVYIPTGITPPEKEAMNETQPFTIKTEPDSPTLPTQQTKVPTEKANIAPILPVQNNKFIIPSGVATLATTPLIKKVSTSDDENSDIKKTSKRRRPLPVYFRDLKKNDTLCPKKVSKMFRVASDTIRKQRVLIRNLRTKSYRYFKRLKTLKENLIRLERSNLELTLDLKSENMFLQERMRELKSKLDQVTSTGVD